MEPLEIELGTFIGYDWGSYIRVDVPSTYPARPSYAVYIIGKRGKQIFLCSCLDHKYRSICDHVNEVADLVA